MLSVSFELMKGRVEKTVELEYSSKKFCFEKKDNGHGRSWNKVWIGNDGRNCAIFLYANGNDIEKRKYDNLEERGSLLKMLLMM